MKSKEIGKYERRIEKLKSKLRYENAEGEHTYHMCPCRRGGCRGDKCQLCLEEDIKDQEAILNDIKKDYGIK